jgi:hypothetical protein
MWNFFEQAKNATKGYVASTSLGKNYAVKPTFQEEIKKAREKLDERSVEVSSNKSLKQHKKLEQVFNKLTAKVFEVIDFIEEDKNLDRIVNVVGNHIGDYKNSDEFLKTLKNTPSYKALRKILADMVDMESHELLATNLQNAQNVDELEVDEQLEVITFLSNNGIIEKIITNNNNLKIEKLKKEIETKGKTLCKDLKLDDQEKQDVIDLFHEITEAFLEDFNAIRADMVKHLPEFLKAEHERILKEQPHLAIETPKSTKKAITPALGNKKRKRVAEEEVKPNPKATKQQKVNLKDEVSEGEEEEEVVVKKPAAKKVATKKK